MGVSRYRRECDAESDLAVRSALLSGRVFEFGETPISVCGATTRCE
jgi:hypothetical protein